MAPVTRYGFPSSVKLGLVVSVPPSAFVDVNINYDYSQIILFLFPSSGMFLDFVCEG